MKVNENNPKRVFSTKKWYESLSKDEIFKKNFLTLKDAIEHYSWVKMCEGKKVINAKIDGFIIIDDWCVNVDEYERIEI